MLIELAKKCLEWPVAFDIYQSLVGAPGCHERFIREMVRPRPGERILDIGCGVGASLRYLPTDISYVGIDISEAYVRQASATFPGRGQFICADLAEVDVEALGTFDRAFAFGVLHHLSDEVAGHLVELVRRVVRTGGRFVSIDPCYVPGQSPIAKWLIDNDRGEHVRNVEGFHHLLMPLGNVDARVFHDLLRIPYTQVICEIHRS